MTPLHWAIQSGFSFIVAELFNMKKLDLNLDAVDEFDDSIRDYVRNSKNNEIIDTFCKYTGENKEDYEVKQTNRVIDVPQNDDDDVDDKKKDESSDYTDSDPESNDDSTSESDSDSDSDNDD